MKIFKKLFSVITAGLIACSIGVNGLPIRVQDSNDSVKHVSAAGYNVDAAVAYAHKYWQNYNPSYPNCNPIGGDCCNFVSQCIYEGGIPQDSTWKVGMSSWQYCPDFVTYFKNKGYTVIDYAKESDIKLGNPVVYWNGNSGRWAHLAICTGFSGSTPLVSAHNKDHIDYEWTLGGPNYWGGSSRRLTILLNGNNPSPFPGEEDTSYSVPMTATANAKCDTYNSSGNVESGRWIDAGDVCTIKKVYKNGFVYVEYPSSSAPGGKREAFAEKKYFDITPATGSSHSPVLCVDVAEGRQGTILISGWAYDEDNRSKSLDIHVYMDDDNKWVGGTVCQYEDEDALKAIVGTASSYYHRFMAEFKTNERGAHRLNIAALDDNGGNATWSGHDIVIGDTVNLGDSFDAQIQNAGNEKYLLVSSNDGDVRQYGKNANEWVTSNKITWHFKRNSDGTYHIMSYYNGKYLDVLGGKDENGTNVCTYDYIEEDLAERWFIISDGNNYKLRPSFSAVRYLDVAGGLSDDNINIQIFSNNDTSAQSFKINKISDTERPYIESVKISDISKSGYKVTITAKDNVGIKEIKVPTWTNKNGQDDLVWHKATQTNVNTWTCTINSADHKNEYGIYYTDVYAYDYSGNYYGCNKEDTNRRTTVKLGVYNVTYEPNGGTASAASKTVTLNSNYGLLATATLAGHTFKGWFTAKDGGTQVTETTVVTTAADHKLYAHWDTNACKVTFNANGGTADKESLSVAYGSKIGTLPSAKKEGYIFTGWYKAKDGNEKITAEEVIKGDAIYYAHWIKTAFKGNGTAESPYLIETADDLVKLAEVTNDITVNPYYSFSCYRQTADINLEGVKWTPIGVYLDADSKYQSSLTFRGIYDGNYHKVTNLKIDYSKNYCGLFGRIGNGKDTCRIQNLSVSGNIKSTAKHTGGIAGETGAKGTIQNCDFTGTVTGEKTGVGAITGTCWGGGNIINCYANAEVTGPEGETGGIIGDAIVGDEAGETEFKLLNSYFTGKVTGSDVHGICGKFSTGTEKKGTVVFENNYYLNTAAENMKEIAGCKALSKEMLKQVYELLGDPFVKDDSEINDGYPVFGWQYVPCEFKGSGTKEDPYQISTAEELRGLSSLVNSKYHAPKYASAYYIQTADIDLGNELFTPIGICDDAGEGAYYTFLGSYNGNYHKITGLNVNYPGAKCAGLFGKVNCGGTGSVSEVRNLSVYGKVSSGKAQITGGIIGEISYETTVENCDFHGTVTGCDKVGGLIGQAWQGYRVSNCYVNAVVNSTKENNQNIGGIIGKIEVGSNNDSKSTDFRIENCYFAGSSETGLNGAIAGNALINTVKEAKIEYANCYFIETAAKGAVSGAEVTGCKSLSETMMKKSAELIGENFADDSAEINDGYPVFKWQINEAATEPEFIPGDANGDGEVTLRDVAAVRKFIMGEKEIDEKAADLNGDGEVNLRDVRVIRKIILGENVA
ncbi:MAG: InlB B-repeat-containing protein [Oscillospiraceae bacterium]|nr:InlB B-repeat-containing protein [Oscillospiraceae bacterium]